jgi:hypothetical protein
MAPNPEKREREGPNTGLGAELAKSWNVAPSPSLSGCIINPEGGRG